MEKFKNVLKIQVLVFVYSLVSLLSKIASNILSKEGMISLNLVVIVLIMLLVLAIYALFWQKILKQNDLSFAYMNKGTQLFWSIIWATVIFQEGVTFFNIIGTLLVFFGIYIVNKHE